MTTRSPATFQTGNLMWTRHGTVWATWILQGRPYGYGTPKAKQEARELHKALIRALPGESLWLGVRAGLDPTAVVERMMAGVDLEQCPDWRAECAATLDSLEDLALGTRVFIVSVPLPDSSRWFAGAQALRAGLVDVTDMLCLPRTTPSEREVRRRRDQAERIRRSIPFWFEPRPVTAAQMAWLQAHIQQRGLYADTTLPSADDGLDDDLLRSAYVVEPLLDEGGRTDLTRSGRWSPREGMDPSRRRFLKIVQADLPGRPAASYQTMLAVADLPRQGMPFPGGEFVGNIDASGIDVDWAIRMQVRTATEAQAKNRRALRNLNDQLFQRSTDSAMSASDLETNVQALDEYMSKLASDTLEVEVAATIIYAVGGTTGEEATEQAEQLADYLESADIRTAVPLGLQQELWWAMQPGVPTRRVVTSYAQISTSHAVAATVPFATTDLGDSKGSTLGTNRTSGLEGIVMHDPEGSTERDVSGSFLAGGELGAGKTSVLKKLGGDVIDRGGILITPDRTPMGEWETWAKSVASAAVVNIADPEYSLCPLHLFGRAAGSSALLSFLTPLLNIRPTEPDGVLLNDVLDPAYLAKHQIISTGALLRHLQEDCVLEGAGDLARKINVFARRPYGRVIFDPDLPALPPGWQALVIRTHTVELPSRDDLHHEHLFRQMKIEKIFGRAIYALIAAVARQICFADRDRLALMLVAEAYHMTMSPESENELKLLVRDGRKHKAAAGLDSHDPERDIPDETLRGLIPTRILMRQTDVGLAKSGLAWLGLDPDDELLVDLVTKQLSPSSGPQGVPEHRRGEGLMRDAAGRIGVIKVLLPAVEARAAAVKTSPTSAGLAAVEGGVMSSARHARRWLARAWVLLVLTPVLWLANTSSARADDANSPPAALAWMEIADSRGISAWDYDMSLDRGGVTDPLKAIWSVLIDGAWSVVYRNIVGFVIWLVDWTLSFEWLGPLETPAQELSNSFSDMIASLGLAPALLAAAGLVALIFLVKGAMATGVYEFFMAALVAALAIGVFANPLGMLTGGEGWLALSRDFGLQVGGALRADGQTADGDPEEVREAISEDLVDIFIRIPHQLVNYNTLLDGTECEDTYDAALQMSHATWVPGMVDGIGGEDDAQPGMKLVDSNGDPIMLPPGSDLADLYGIADDKVAFQAAWNEVPDARSIVATCNEYAGEVAENPSATQVTNAFILSLGGLFLAVLALVLCGCVWVAVVHAMWLSVKALWQLLTGILPGGQRLALMRTAADLGIALALVVFALVFLVAYLQLILAVFLVMDGSPMMKFAVLDLLLLAGVVVFWRTRRRMKAGGGRLASALSKRPGSPVKAMPSPHSGGRGAFASRYYALRARQAARAVESTGGGLGGAGGVVRRSALASLKGEKFIPQRRRPDENGRYPLTQGNRPPPTARGWGGDGDAGPPSPGGGSPTGRPAGGPGLGHPRQRTRELPPGQKEAAAAKRDRLRSRLNETSTPASRGRRRIAGERPQAGDSHRKAGDRDRSNDGPRGFIRVVRGGRELYVPARRGRR